MSGNEYTFAVGAVVGFHALAGEVKVRPSTNNPEILLEMTSLRLVPSQPKSAEAILKLRSIRIERKILLLAFEGYPDRTSVEHMMSSQLYCKPSELLPLSDDEFWVKDLVGLSVFKTTGEHVGEVVSIIYGGNDLIEVQRPGDAPGKTILIPFVQNLVPHVDLKSKRIEIVDLPGLLEAQ